MPDILLQGLVLPAEPTAFTIFPNGDVYDFFADYKYGTAVQLPQHGDLIETKDVLLALVEHGQRDKRFKLGDTIRYSPSEVKEIIDASVPVVVPAEKGETQ